MARAAQGAGRRRGVQAGGGGGGGGGLGEGAARKIQGNAVLRRAALGRASGPRQAGWDGLILTCVCAVPQ